MTPTQRKAMEQALEAFDGGSYEQLLAAAALRAALAEQPAEQAQVALHQFHKRGCADWYDGLPDHEDGGGPYETRTLYTTPQPAIPPGYKLVPVEPTREMLEMGQWLEYPESGSRMQPVRMEDVRGVWKAMLAAAPEAPQPAKRVPLTDEELRDALRQCPHDTVENLRVRWLYAKDFARAIERAHGITGETK